MGYPGRFKPDQPAPEGVLKTPKLCLPPRDDVRINELMVIKDIV